MMRRNNLVKDCFGQWTMFIRRFKLATKFLKRSNNGIEQSMKNEAFTNWKKCVFKARKMVFEENIEELGRRQEDHQEQIKNLKKKVSMNESSQKHLESKLQTQAQRVMKNYISRLIHSSIAKGFITWKEKLSEQKRKSRIVKSSF